MEIIRQAVEAAWD